VEFVATPLHGAYVLELERLSDPRGFFARTWSVEEFEAHGLNSRQVQCNISFNPRKGTLRGMHAQRAPYAETKLVRCTMGEIYDVIIDLRPDSPTYLQHYAVELSATNRRALYIPEGFLHGYQTLTEDAEVFYHISEFYKPEAAFGARWNDPVFGISWPLPDPFMADRDRNYPDYVPVK